MHLEAILGAGPTTATIATRDINTTEKNAWWPIAKPRRQNIVSSPMAIGIVIGIININAGRLS